MAEPAPSPDGNKPSDDHKGTSLSFLDKLRKKQPDDGRLHHHYGPLIQYWCSRAGIASPEIIEDVRQEVYLVAVAKIGTFCRRGPGAFRAWLRGITHTCLQAHFRKAAEQACAEGGTDAGRRLDERPDPADDDEDDPEEQKAELLHRVLEFIQAEFSALHWDMFRLRFIEGQTVSEVARQLNQRPNTVSQVISRIKQRVQEELGDDDGSDADTAPE
jgi:RNA polymerase sigma-70 factor (ECF subfamily)